MLWEGRSEDVNRHGNQQVFIVEHCLRNPNPSPFFANYWKQTEANSRNYSTISWWDVIRSLEQSHSHAGPFLESESEGHVYLHVQSLSRSLLRCYPAPSPVWSGGLRMRISGRQTSRVLWHKLLPGKVFHSPLCNICLLVRFVVWHYLVLLPYCPWGWDAWNTSLPSDLTHTNS